jgi:clan AA aspartic protease
MGMTKVQLTIKNPQDPAKAHQDNFLVDSGATYTVVPEKILKQLDIKPQGEETFILADGTDITRKVGSALFQYQGIERAAPVLFGKPGDSLLLGTFTLEALGLTLDPLQHTLHKAVLRM